MKKTEPVLDYWEDDGAAEIAEQMVRDGWILNAKNIREAVSDTFENVNEIEEYDDFHVTQVAAAVAFKLWEKEEAIDRRTVEALLAAANWEPIDLQGGP